MVENEVGYVVMTYLGFRTLLSGHFVPLGCFCMSLGRCSFTNRLAHVTKVHKSGVREMYSTVSVTFRTLTSIVIRRQKNMLYVARMSTLWCHYTHLIQRSMLLPNPTSIQGANQC